LSDARHPDAIPPATAGVSSNRPQADRESGEEPRARNWAWRAGFMAPAAVA